MPDRGQWAVAKSADANTEEDIRGRCVAANFSNVLEYQECAYMARGGCSCLGRLLKLILTSVSIAGRRRRGEGRETRKEKETKEGVALATAYYIYARCRTATSLGTRPATESVVGYHASWAQNAEL